MGQEWLATEVVRVSAREDPGMDLDHQPNLLN